MKLASPRGKISFLPLAKAHMPLIHQWLRESHVAAFWKSAETAEQVEREFLSLSRDVLRFVISIDDKPIGYIQQYNASLAGEGWWPDAKPGTFGVDLFIGVESLTGHGLGTDVIRQFTTDLFSREKCEEVIVDPTPENLRAIRAYEKAGFARVGPIRTPDGEALLMRLTRKGLMSK